jgi:integrase
MAAYRLYKVKKSSNWQVDFGEINGNRTRESARTEDKKQAEAFAKHRSTELWRQEKLGEQPSVTWDHAVIEWVKANENKKYLDNYRQHLRKLSEFFRGRDIAGILVGDINRFGESLRDVMPATRNRYIATASAILGYAHNNGWLHHRIRLQRHREGINKNRFLTTAEAARLLAELPNYLRDMAAFSLATGLRESNVRLLEWSNVDLERSIAWVHGDQAKAGKSLAVPLNASAMNVLRERYGQHWKWVFELNGRPLYQCNNTAWKSALRRAGISGFRWHDLRHTWASWHVQNGTSLYDLKTLGGWASMAMVERYAHMTHERVAAVSGNIDHILAESCHTTPKNVTPDSLQTIDSIGRSWQARTADQRIKSPVVDMAVGPTLSNNIIDLRKKNASRTRRKFAKTDKSLPRETKVLAEIRHTKRGGK